MDNSIICDYDGRAFSSGVIDGLDGLAGGVMAIIFAAYTGIAYFQNQIDLAAFARRLPVAHWPSYGSTFHQRVFICQKPEFSDSLPH